HAGDALTEDGLGAVRRRATEAADEQADGDAPAVAGQIGDGPPVAAVDPGGGATAPRAVGGGGGGCQRQDGGAGGDEEVGEGEAGEVNVEVVCGHGRASCWGCGEHHPDVLTGACHQVRGRASLT